MRHITKITVSSVSWSFKYSYVTFSLGEKIVQCTMKKVSIPFTCVKGWEYRRDDRTQFGTELMGRKWTMLLFVFATSHKF